MFGAERPPGGLGSCWVQSLSLRGPGWPNSSSTRCEQPGCALGCVGSTAAVPRERNTSPSTSVGLPSSRGDTEIPARVPPMATSGSTRPERRKAARGISGRTQSDPAQQAGSVTRSKGPAPQIWTGEMRYWKKNLTTMGQHLPETCCEEFPSCNVLQTAAQ